MNTALEKLSKQDLIDRMDVLQEVAIAFLSGKSKKEAMTLLVEKAMELCPCDGATLYLLDSEKEKINSEVMVNSTFGNKDFTSFSIPLKAQSIATYCFLNNESLLIDDVYILDPVMGVKFNVAMDERMEYRTKSMIALPMTSLEGTVVGLIQLINRKNFLSENWPKDSRALSEMRGFSSADKEMLERLIRLSVAALENWYNPSANLPEFKVHEDFLV